MSRGSGQPGKKLSRNVMCGLLEKLSHFKILFMLFPLFNSQVLSYIVCLLVCVITGFLSVRMSDSESVSCAFSWTLPSVCLFCPCGGLEENGPQAHRE